MSSRPDTDDFRTLFLHGTPLMDVRAPVEFERGSFPGALNAPLMNDDERHEVGICYKERGQEAAIELGHRLVRDDIKAQRIAAWERFARDNPDGYLFCFRGGLRSRLTQQWMREAGIDFPLVIGGYKALRRYLIDQLETLSASASLILVSGRTGTGKTRLLEQLPNPVDLEGLANHRGSSFGRQVTPQPGQIDFENRLAVSLLQATQGGRPVFVEDESRLIGRCCLPHTLQDTMATAPLMVLERPMSERVAIIREDYVETMLADFIRREGEAAGWHHFRDYLTSAMDRIRRRLGGERHRRLRAILDQALDQQQAQGDLSGHNHWIEALLTDYYDPMYDFQMAQREGRIAIRGHENELVAWARQHYPENWQN